MQERHSEGRTLQQTLDAGDFRHVITHEHLISAIKNQESILSSIFTPPNAEILVSYINSQHPLDPECPDLSYKLPYAAMEILCCECHLLTELLFKHETGEGKLLLDSLLEFLEGQEHYILASNFSKTMIAITKRVFSPDHRFNSIMCDRVFARKALLHCLNHLYSGSTNELVVRWLTLKGKNQDYQSDKNQFLTQLLSLMNGQSVPSVTNFADSSCQTAAQLIMLLLKSPLEPVPAQPQPIQHKNYNLLGKVNQQELYNLVCTETILREILKPIPNPHIQKLKLATKIVEKLRTENEILEQQQEKYPHTHLSEAITFQMLVECLEWAKQHIEDLVSSHWDSEKGTMGPDFPKANLVATLEFLYQLHILPELGETLQFVYEQKEFEQVESLVKLLRLRNNIIQNSISNIIMVVLKKLKCPDFERALLHEGISQLIDEEGIREHLLGWAKIILNTKAERGHIYENPAEESKWQHMAAVVEAAEEVQIGNFRFKPSTLPIFYSANKAKEEYADFLAEGVRIEYESKELAQPKMRKNISSPPDIVYHQPPQAQKEQAEAKDSIIEQESEELVWMRAGYLSFDVSRLIDEL